MRTTLALAGAAAFVLLIAAPLSIAQTQPAMPPTKNAAGCDSHRADASAGDLAVNHDAGGAGSCVP